MFELKNNSKIISRVDLRGCDPCHWDDEDRYQYIVKKDDKYGVLDFRGDVLIPLKYDNIVLVERYCYLLTINGKMGLNRICRRRDKNRQYHIIKNVIPCEYDYIEISRGLGMHYVLHKTTEMGTSIKVYLCTTSTFTEEYDFYCYVEGGFIELYKGETRIVIDTCSGEIIADDNRFSVAQTYKTDIGRVIYDYSKLEIGRLIFAIVDENSGMVEYKTIEFEGDLEVVFGSLEQILPKAVAFKITDKNGKVKFLNAIAEYVVI